MCLKYYFLFHLNHKWAICIYSRFILWFSWLYVRASIFWHRLGLWIGSSFCVFLLRQTWIMKEYPAEVTVVFFYNLCVSILAGIVGFFTEPDSNKWIIKPDIALASILCSVSETRSILDISSPLYIFCFVCSCTMKCVLLHHTGNIRLIPKQYNSHLGFACERTSVCIYV